VQPPTTDPEELENTILSLTTGRGTAIGEGIVTALDAIAEFSQSAAAGAELEAQARAAATSPAEDEYQPDIVVLLTDGNYNAGIDPLEAAREAADRGVRVYTIGYGTEAGAMGRNTMARGGHFGLDEASLEAIASTTGGEYYTASSAGELQEVFDSLPTVLITREETLEISVIAAAVAALLVTGAVLLSQRWQPLP